MAQQHINSGLLSDQARLAAQADFAEIYASLNASLGLSLSPRNLNAGLSAEQLRAAMQANFTDVYATLAAQGVTGSQKHVNAGLSAEQIRAVLQANFTDVYALLGSVNHSPNTLNAATGYFTLLGDIMTPAVDRVVPATFGSFTLTGEDAALTKTGTSYTGPGDLTASALWWGGLRAYNAAYATGSNPAIDIVDQAGANALTVNILATGYLDIASINTWVVAHSVTTIRVTKIYDQSGGAQHATQFTLGNMPQLVLNPTGMTASRAALFFASSRSDQIVSSGVGFTSGQPFTISAVANRTTTQTSVRGGIVSLNSGGVRFGYEANANTFFQYAGGGLNDVGTSANNTWYGLQAVFNGASSLVNVNGANTATNNPGTTGPSSSAVAWGNTSSGDFLDGYIAELGVWSGSVSTSMGSNQQSAWGF